MHFRTRIDVLCCSNKVQLGIIFNYADTPFDDNDVFLFHLTPTYVKLPPVRPVSPEVKCNSKLLHLVTGGSKAPEFVAVAADCSCPS
jgi:hypothetical protein